MDQPPYTPPGGPPQIPPPSKEILPLMGEEAVIRMLADFYTELEKSSIRSMFPADMLGSSRKSALYFIQLLGGPPRFTESHGPPRLRSRHMFFPIDEKARKAWLECFMKTLEDAESKYGFPPQHLEGFKVFLREFSGWMVNRQ